MDQFAAMRAFVKVVETNGFSEAAQLHGSILDNPSGECSGRYA